MGSDLAAKSRLALVHRYREQPNWLDLELPDLQRSLAMRRQLGNQHGAASSLRRLAIAHREVAEIGTALWYLWQSLALYWRPGMLRRQRLITMVKEFLQGVEGKQWTC